MTTLSYLQLTQGESRFLHLTDSMTTLSYLQLKQGESRFVHFPVLPLVIGKKIKITIVAHSFVNSVTVTKSVNVVVRMHCFHSWFVNVLHYQFVLVILRLTYTRLVYHIATTLCMSLHERHAY